MPSKTEEYLALAQRTANGLTRYWESWTAYLTTASVASAINLNRKNFLGQTLCKTKPYRRIHLVSST